MKTQLSLLTGALALLVAAPVRAEIIATTNLNIPIVALNNPCTAGPDSIDGVLNLNAIADRRADGVITLYLSGRGSGSDANNQFYRFLTSGTVQFHDPLPADINLSVRLTTANTASNARLGLVLHVSEQGRITSVGQSGLQCGGF